MGIKNIPFHDSCTSHFGDPRKSYVRMRAEQIYTIIRPDDIKQVAQQLFPNLKPESCKSAKDYAAKCQSLVEKAVETLAGAEFDTQTQYEPKRDVLVDALTKVSLRDVPKARRFLSDAQNPVIVPDFSEGRSRHGRDVVIPDFSGHGR